MPDVVIMACPMFILLINNAILNITSKQKVSERDNEIYRLNVLTKIKIFIIQFMYAQYYHSQCYHKVFSLTPRVEEDSRNQWSGLEWFLFSAGPPGSLQDC